MHSHPTQTQYCPERPDMRNIPFILLSSLPFLFHLHTHTAVSTHFSFLSSSIVLIFPCSYYFLGLCPPLTYLPCLILNFAVSFLYYPCSPFLFNNLLLPPPFIANSSPSSTHSYFPAHPFYSLLLFSAPQAIPYLTTYLLPRQLHSTIEYSSHTHTYTPRLNLLYCLVVLFLHV